MERKSAPITMKRRKTLRAFRKGYVDKEREEEGGDAYICGGF